MRYSSDQPYLTTCVRCIAAALSLAVGASQAAAQQPNPPASPSGWQTGIDKTFSLSPPPPAPAPAVIQPIPPGQG
jgi:hypothetical protein